MRSEELSTTIYAAASHIVESCEIYIAYDASEGSERKFLLTSFHLSRPLLPLRLNSSPENVIYVSNEVVTELGIILIC